MNDCGCGGGSNCITKHKKQFKQWVKAELQRLDCGCGCKGKTKFEEKYGQLVGGKLKDCPPGWRNDGLTCVENCNPDERDDGLTCRKKCEPGWIDDGLTCRKPITSSIDPCPEGSRDVAGTCWGPVRQDCIDDCFKHPAPGCRTYECGRLLGAFGEDWGPKLCTDCNLRCGPTCWDVMGITRHLHQRNLRLAGGEVVLQAIRGKRIQGRVDWEATFAEIEAGVKDVFENNPGLAMLFDPNKNGVNAAFRKFGDDAKAAFEEVGRKTKESFDKMGADAKAAFEKFAKDAEGNLTNMLGKEFMDKMKDPKFWIEAAAIMAQVGATVLGVLITAGTLGVGAAAGAAIIMAANMAGPAIRMIGKAAMGEPIDALDIADMALSAIPAPGPGKAASSLIGKAVQTVIRNGATIKAIGGLVISGVKAGQAIGVIPSSCIGPNCPAPDPPPGPDAPIGDYDSKNPPKVPSDDPPPAGQLTDDQILDLADQTIFKNKIIVNGVKITNPNYMAPVTWVQKYRNEHYGTPLTTPSGAVTTSNEQKIDNLPGGAPEPPVEIPDPVDELGLENDEIVPLSFDDDEEDIIPFTFDGEGEQEGEQVNIEGEVVVPEAEAEAEAEAEIPKQIKPVGEPLTDEEIAELQPQDTVNRLIKVDGVKVKNPKYMTTTDWIQQYKANLASMPTIQEVPEGEIAPFSFEEEAVPEGEIAPLSFGEEDEGEIAPLSFGEEDEGEIAPLSFGEEAVPEGEIAPLSFEEEAVPEGEIKPLSFEEEDETQYEIENLDENQCGRQFQEDELIGSAEPGDDIEPLVDGDVIENPFGSLSTTVERPFVPKTHKGNRFVVECYAAKNPEVATALNNDYEKLIGHWIEIGVKQGLDADCGEGTSTMEERIQLLQQQEKLRLETEAKKVNCKATDRFWIESEERCDGFRDAEGKVNTEAAECKRQGNFWDDEFGFKFCNELKDPSGNPKSGKEFCNSQNNYWNGTTCIASKNVDGTPKNFEDLCTQGNAFVHDTDTAEYRNNYALRADFNKFCDVTKDKYGEPVTEEQLCKESNSYFKDGKCNVKLFPNGQPKPQQYIDLVYGANDSTTDEYKRKMNKIKYGLPGNAVDEVRKNQDEHYKKLQDLENKRWAIEVEKILAKQRKEILQLFDPVYFAKTFPSEADKAIGRNVFTDIYFSDQGEKLTREEKDGRKLITTNPNPPLTKDEIDKLKVRWITRSYFENYEGTPGIRLNPELPPGAGVGDWGRNNIKYRFYELAMNSLINRKWKGNEKDFLKYINDEIVDLDDATINKYRSDQIDLLNTAGVPANSDLYSGAGKPSFTLYWAEWCPHCHTIIPEWKKLKHKGVQIEAIEEKDSRIKVDGYPTILFRNGKKVEKYTGPRTAKAMKTFLKNKLS